MAEAVTGSLADLKKGCTDSNEIFFEDISLAFSNIRSNQSPLFIG
jgi:hypothetical protein